MIEKKAIENAKKEASIREVRKESLRKQGPLYVAPEYKRQGHVTHWVAAVPGEIEHKERLGFKVVQKQDIEVGDGKPKDSSKFGSAVTVQSKCGTLLVLMETTIDNWRAIEEDQFAENAENLSAINTIEGISPENQYGAVKFGKDK